jgi:uncharacterized protein
VRELVVDTGPLFALLDADDRRHGTCRELLETFPGRLVVPQLVIAEVAHFVAARLTADVEIRLLGDFAAGVLEADPVHPMDWLRMAELVSLYADLGLGITDASVIACAERRGAVELATLDRRDFATVRPAHADAFTLLPDLAG